MPTDRAREKTYGGHEIVGNVGDISIGQFDGGIVYKNKDDGSYTLEWCEPPDDSIDFNDKNARWKIYRVELDKEVPDWGNVKAVAKTVGERPSHLKDDFESDDPMRRASAYLSWASHYGWENFDEYALVLDKDEIESRYSVEIGDEEDEEEEEEGEEEEEEEDEDLFSKEDMRESYTIQDARRGIGYDVFQDGKSQGNFDDKDEALAFIRKHMKQENFYPNIYYVNERGNVDLLDEKGNILESRV